ncbi:MAG: DUF2163 domain-containing protein [Pseudomonadota bacterium]
MALSAEFEAHLASTTTTLCRCWLVRRADGVELGFTDHDRDLAFEGAVFEAGTGLTASALEQTSGLSVNNSSALGALSAASVTDADLTAGRFDGAEVLAYLVNWADPGQRVLQFRGSLGEIRRGSGAFEAELRGLTEALNQPRGRMYHSRCSAVLGSPACGFDLNTPGYFTETTVISVDKGKRFRIAGGAEFAERWFERGRFEITSGGAAGLTAIVKNDRVDGAERVIELWEAVRAEVSAGDMIRVEAGCDGRKDTCVAKFGNLMNFRGFPDIPGEDWLMAYPTSADANDGGSLR